MVFTAAWTDEEKDDACLPWDQFRAKHPGRTYDAWRVQRLALRKNGLLKAPPKPETLVDTEPDRRDVEALIDLLIDLEEKAGKFERAKTQIEVTIPAEHPIGVVFISDLHCGGEGVAMRRMKDDVKRIAETPGLYCVLGGDFVNNFIGPKLEHAGRGDVRPALQWKIAHWVVETLLDKVVCVGSGNHDDWTRRYADLDPIASMLKGTPVQYIGEGGTIDLTVGSQRYRIYRKHRGRSSINDPLWGARSLLRRPEVCDPIPDIVGVEHHHEPAISEEVWAGKPVILFRTGSYKVQDQHARNFGFYGARVGTPVVVLHAGQKKMEGKAGLEEGCERLERWW